MLYEVITLPAQSLTYSLAAGALSVATINGLGRVTWTTTETDGPGVYPLTIQVTDGSRITSYNVCYTKLLRRAVSST